MFLVCRWTWVCVPRGVHICAVCACVMYLHVEARGQPDLWNFVLAVETSSEVLALPAGIRFCSVLTSCLEYFLTSCFKVKFQACFLLPYPVSISNQAHPWRAERDSWTIRQPGIFTASSWGIQRQQDTSSLAAQRWHIVAPLCMHQGPIKGLVFPSHHTPRGSLCTSSS